MKRVTFFVFVTVFCILSLSAQAAFVSEAVFALAYRDYQQLLQTDKNFEPAREKLDDRQFTDPVETKLKNIQILYQRKLTLAKPAKDGRTVKYTFSLKQPVVKIAQIDSQGTLKIIDRNTGEEIHIPLKASCRNITSTFRGERIDIQGKLLVRANKNKLELEAVNDTNDIGANKWFTEIENCSAGNIENYREELAKKINETLKDELQSEMEKALHRQIQIAEKDLNKKILSVKKLGTIQQAENHFRPSSVRINARGTMLLQGKLVTTFKNKKYRRYLKMRSDFRDLDRLDQSQIIVPQPYIATMLKTYHENGLIEKWVHGRHFPGFQELRNSGFKQWVVWPDLGRYPASTKFLFHIKSRRKGPQLGRSWSIPGGVLSRMNLEFVIRTLRKPGSRYLPYVNFYTRQSGDLCMQFTRNGIEMKFGVLRRDWKYYWAKGYDNHHDISIDLLADVLQKQVDDLGVTLPFKPLIIDGKIKLRPYKVSRISGKDWGIALTRDPRKVGNIRNCHKYLPHQG